jgi:lysophospholipase L1-like esterase
VPRNIWKDCKIVRTADGHADWTREVAAAEHVPFLDLHETIASRYDALGQAAVNPLFADGRVHTTKAGAQLSAECVVAALRALPQDPLAPYLLAPAPQK